MSFDDFVRGKTVALVGPANSTEDMKIGRFIDSHDLVARVGDTFEELVIDEVGGRTDIVYENFWDYNEESLRKVLPIWKDRGVQWIVQIYSPTRWYNRFEQLKNGTMSSTVVEQWRLDKTREKVESPTRGWCAISDLVTRDIKSLFIAGFTFNHGWLYRRESAVNSIYGWNNPELTTKTRNHNELSLRVTAHDHSLELKEFKKLTESDARISCDEILSRILKGVN